MKLYVLRHGIAVDRGTPGYERDADRCLTPEGQEKMEQAARGMAALGLEFDLILTSPYVRARETAEIVARVLGLEERLEVCDALVPGGSRKDLFKRLKECAADSQLVIVGHEPDLSELIGELIAGDPNTALDLKKGSLAALSFDRPTRPETAFLEWLLTPRQLRMLGGVIRDT
jgi:phosphohistidine phosphatase